MKPINKEYNKLTPEEEEVIIHKWTEAPFSGKYNDFHENGVFVCKRCGAQLYLSKDKFDSGCGWPSFDDEIPWSIKRILDKDWIRTEIVCSNCNAHLGHVFVGENLTPKNIHHCVNSLSLDFKKKYKNTQKAYFAGWCFWWLEYHFEKQPGVISTKVGYMWWNIPNPSYEQVCYQDTGHLEVLEIIFDTKKQSFEELAKHFFEIHDPTQIDWQWPDIGDQYHSVIFYINNKQKSISKKLIDILKNKWYNVVTKIKAATTFWEAEVYHQKYYSKINSLPYCHIYTKRF